LWPQVLPGGHTVLFTSSDLTGAYNDANIVVQTLDGGIRKVVQRGGYYGRYLASGHLVFMHNGTLFAARFDLGRLEVTSAPMPVIDDVMSNSLTGGAQLAMAENGTLVYLPGLTTGVGLPLDLIDEAGQTTALRFKASNWINPRFSPDGRRIALEVRDLSTHIFLYDWSRDGLTRLTSSPAFGRKPVWTPDGRRIAFGSPAANGATTNVYWQLADGGAPKRLTDSPHLQLPASFHPSGKFLVLEENNPESQFDVMVLGLDGSDAADWKPVRPWPFANAAYAEFDPVFSTDGRWVAYTAVEGGRPQVFVRAFPGPGPIVVVALGANPVWSSTTDELIYGSNGQVMRAAYEAAGTTFRVTSTRAWPGASYETRGPMRMFDLHPDGKRLALARAVPLATQNTLVFVFNFFDELRRKLP
jgi:dipeptidyl aminopeptidase/acylaminoacyl peptidase